MDRGDKPRNITERESVRRPAPLGQRPGRKASPRGGGPRGRRCFGRPTHPQLSSRAPGLRRGRLCARDPSLSEFRSVTGGGSVAAGNKRTERAEPCIAGTSPAMTRRESPAPRRPMRPLRSTDPIGSRLPHPEPALWPRAVPRDVETPRTAWESGRPRAPRRPACRRAPALRRQACCRLLPRGQ
jgi:hypothetical protein